MQLPEKVSIIDIINISNYEKALHQYHICYKIYLNYEQNYTYYFEIYYEKYQQLTWIRDFYPKVDVLFEDGLKNCKTYQNQLSDIDRQLKYIYDTFIL